MKWIDTTVGDYCPFIYGKGLPQNKRIQGEFPVYGSNGIVDSHSESLIQTPGIIIGRKGSCGAVNISTGAFWPIDTTFYVTKDSLHELYFTYYLLKTLGLETMNSDSAVPGLNRDNAHNVRIRIPEKKEDREKLGYKLFVFDNKIANNTAMNQTLEKIAQRIFKSWFIDFDPVKANAEGVPFNGLSPEIQALFPSEFEESELGMIPKGWKAGSLGDFTKVQGGYAYKSKSFTEQGNPVVKIKNIVGDGTINLSDCQCISNEIADSTDKFKLVDGDILMAMTGATVGKSGLYVSDGRVSYLNQRVARFKSPKTHFFTYLNVNQSRVFETIVKTADGSAQPNISATGIEQASAVVPSESIIAEFEIVVRPLFTRVIANAAQNVTLNNLRNRLLPKLILGQISLSDANQELKETE